MLERKEMFANLSNEELNYLSKKMKKNYVRVKRINFDISESYLKDCRAIDLVLQERYEESLKKVSA